jgi:hypothetical protein
MPIFSFAFRPTLAAAACAALCTSMAVAETTPYYIGVSQAFTHDTNVFRATEGNEISDTYSSTGLLAGINQPFGRQRFYLNGNARYNKFQDTEALNNTSYGLFTGLDLATVNNLSGAINYGLNQSLSNYGGINLVQNSGKNIERTQQMLGRVTWGMVSLLGLELTGNRRSVRYSSALYDPYELDQNAVSLGVTYRPSDLLSLGAAYRVTRGEYRASGIRFDRDDIDLTTTWVPSGQSTVNARLSFGKQDSSATALDRNSFSSGSIAWDYRPTGKLALRLWASRDTGAEATFFNFDTVGGGTQTAVGDTSAVTRTVMFSGNYAATAKIGLNASVRRADRDLDNSVLLGSLGGAAVSGSDVTTVYSLSATYQALRSLQFACGVGHERRTSSGSTSFPYTAKTASCSAQFVLQ